MDLSSNRKQRVLLNGQMSTWTSVNVGVPQESILSPLLLLIYINDYYLTNYHLVSNYLLMTC